MYDETLDSAFSFMVNSNLVDFEHGIDRTGQILGIVAGSHESRRHWLVEFLLQKEADPKQVVERYGDLTAFAAAAGDSDQKMVSIT